ncbi:hypothetical protein [Paraliomyxa miuraensis]|uniref:hypothetical protein n=1 Tax=Paraliomyxa miuraensis TaxID=376150 RepID=UPI0022583FDA|nr:hypothetical protein [Paraliomyxa miuraensis]MCX4244829.1 hypothetical protein [Paraliomyxa miuraensis]
MSTRSRGRRLLERARRNRWGAREEAPRSPAFGLEDEGPPPESAPAGVGWDHTVRSTTHALPSAALGTDDVRAQLLSLLADPRTSSITASAAASALGLPHPDVETTLDAMAQAGELMRVGGVPKRYHLSAEDKVRLEALFRDSAHELGEHGVLVQTAPDDALAPLDDEAEEPRLPVTAGLLSMFLPGTGQLLNGDVGRASLVFAVWSLAWITQLSPVWTFVCLYAGAEAFFTAKIRSMERKLAKEAALGPATPPTAGQLPPKPST